MAEAAAVRSFPPAQSALSAVESCFSSQGPNSGSANTGRSLARSGRTSSRRDCPAYRSIVTGTSSIEESTILFREMRFGTGHLERYSKAGAVPNVDEAFVHNRIWQAFDNVVPPIRLAEWVLERNIILRQGDGHMDVSREADQAIEDAVRRHRDAVDVCVFGDPLKFGDAPDIFRVGSDYVDGLLLNQVLKVLPEVDLFSGMDGDGRGLLEVAE